MTTMTPNNPVTRIHTPLCELLNIPHPIVLGGMASGTGEVIARLIREAHVVITRRLAPLVTPPASASH